MLSRGLPSGISSTGKNTGKHVEVGKHSGWDSLLQERTIRGESSGNDKGIGT